MRSSIRGERLLARLVVPLTVAFMLCMGAFGPAQARVATNPHPDSPYTITRDRYGVPHVKASTDVGLMQGVGYAQAQDRLFQMELFRHVAEGTLANILGPLLLSSDEQIRLQYYTAAELGAQIAATPKVYQREVQGYADGVNLYLSEAYKDPGTGKLMVPHEFYTLGALLGQTGPYRPAPWTITDTVAIGIFMARSAGTGGGQELNYQQLLQYLLQELPSVGFNVNDAYDVFSDIRWLDDPTAPTTEPAKGANNPVIGEPQVPNSALRTGQLPQYSRAQEAQLLKNSYAKLSDISPAALQKAAAAWNLHQTVWEQVTTALRVPFHDGSNAWAIAPKLSAHNDTLLWGGPQQGFIVPNVDAEEYLDSPSYHVAGIYVPGEPYVFVGHNRDVSWTTTSEETINQTLYREYLDNYTHPTRYLFNGVWQPLTVITETIPVSGGKAVPYVIYRTGHGPISSIDPVNKLAISVRYASWGKEVTSLFQGFTGFNRAATVANFQTAVSHVSTLQNFVMMDRKGNIGYWAAGLVPELPALYDPRLLLPGDGTAEWRGTIPFAQMPHSINPTQGYLDNWNTKPSQQLYYQQNNGDEYWGTIYRSSQISQLITTSQHIDVPYMQQMEHAVGTLDHTNDRARASFPYLWPFVNTSYHNLVANHDPLVNPATHPHLAKTMATLAAWDGVTTLAAPAMSIWLQWWYAFRDNLFGGGLNLNGAEPYTGVVNLNDILVGGLNSYVADASNNLALHVLQSNAGQPTGVPQRFQHDYFNGHRDQLIVESVNDAITLLSGTGPLLETGTNGFGTPHVSQWGYQPPQDLNFDSLLPFDLDVTTHFGTAASQNRSTYMIISEAKPTGIVSQSTLAPGQSGFISQATLQPAAHFADQIDLFRNFKYKPMTNL